MTENLANDAEVWRCSTKLCDFALKLEAEPCSRASERSESLSWYRDTDRDGVKERQKALGSDMRDAVREGDQSYRARYARVFERKAYVHRLKLILI